jgi:hypothetical protein
MIVMPNDLLSDPVWLAKHQDARRTALAKPALVLPPVEKSVSAGVTIKTQAPPMSAFEQFDSAVKELQKRAEVDGKVLLYAEAATQVNASFPGLYKQAIGPASTAPGPCQSIALEIAKNYVGIGRVQTISAGIDLAHREYPGWVKAASEEGWDEAGRG